MFISLNRREEKVFNRKPNLKIQRKTQFKSEGKIRRRKGEPNASAKSAPHFHSLCFEFSHSIGEQHFCNKKN